MSKERFHFNEEQFQYEKVTFSKRDFARQVLIFLLGGICIAVGIMTVYFIFFDTSEEEILKSQNREIENKIAFYHAQLDTLNLELEELRMLDQQLYKSILNAEPPDSAPVEKRMPGPNKSLTLSEERINEIDKKLKVRQKSLQDLEQTVGELKTKLQSIPAIRPVDGVIISGFGIRKHPIHKVDRQHPGIDFGVQPGTKVLATGNGIIRFAGHHKSGFGTTIEIDHGFGYVTVYAHLSKTMVGPGTKVRRGDVIGYSGNSGISKGPHLHYEILKNGKQINPVDYFYSELSPEIYKEFNEQAARYNESMD